MKYPYLAAIFLASLATLHAETRPWRDANGQRAIQGEFVKRDANSVTVRRSDGTSVTIRLDMLFPEDRTWLNANHPQPGAEATDPSEIFDKLKFGDSREEVQKKLKASRFVEMTVDDTFIGRTGLNGVFRTRKKIGGLDASLYFDWTESGLLKEINLQTDPLPESDLETKLVPCWKDFAELLTTLQGQPLVAQKEIRLSSIQDGQLQSTHLWDLEGAGSARLGAARDGTRFQIVVRFTKDKVKPVAVP